MLQLIALAASEHFPFAEGERGGEMEKVWRVGVDKKGNKGCKMSTAMASLTHRWSALRLY